MIIKVEMAMFIEVRDAEQGEAACSLLSNGATDVLGRDFPEGDIWKVAVDRFTEATKEELEEQGLVE